MLKQEELFLSGPHNETPRRKYIRAFAEGGKPDRAKELFKNDFLQLLRAYGGDVETYEVKSFSEFGRDVLGEVLGLQIIAECIDQVVAEIEASQKAQERGREAV